MVFILYYIYIYRERFTDFLTLYLVHIILVNIFKMNIRRMSFTTWRPHHLDFISFENPSWETPPTTVWTWWHLLETPPLRTIIKAVNWLFPVLGYHIRIFCEIMRNQIPWGPQGSIKIFRIL